MEVPDYRQLNCDLLLEVYNAFEELQVQTLDTTHINSFLKEREITNFSPSKMSKHPTPILAF